MKVLTNDQFATLQAKASNYEALVNQIVESGEGLTAEDVTPESILALMTPEAADAPAENAEVMNALNDQVADLTAQLEQAVAERDALQAEVDELKELPGEVSTPHAPEGKNDDDTSIDEVNAFVSSSDDFAACVEKVRAIL